MIGQPHINERKEQPYMGIRTQTPLKGMGNVIKKITKELDAWALRNGLERAGWPFLRYHVIDMAGQMDIEVGIPVAAAMAGDQRVHPGVLPAGRYASLVYRGSGLDGNKALVEWAQAKGIQWDRWDDPQGDGFRCRYESYLTDPKVEPKKTRWDIEVAIKVKDDSAV